MTCHVQGNSYKAISGFLIKNLTSQERVGKYIQNIKKKKNPTCITRDFPGSPVVKNLPANAGDTGSIPGPGRFHMPWGN